MRNAVPLRWIEEAETREVLTSALFERLAKASPGEDMRSRNIPLLDRLRSRFARDGGWELRLLAPEPALCAVPALCALPALCAVPANRAERGSRSRPDDGYSCIW